jgi:hypothetical protein
MTRNKGADWKWKYKNARANAFLELVFTKLNPIAVLLDL